MKERDIEAYLVRRVKELGGEVRKVKWIGRQGAPDRLVMLPRGFPSEQWAPDLTLWVELKSPAKAATFPANAHERKQAREHDRMRKMGQEVFVIGTLEGVDRMLA